jgi:tRNA nucleotidyltransferase (CCA-adding enzyme)
MKIYKVGGWCRDTILKLQPKDIDYVVVGATPNDMIKKGFTQAYELPIVFRDDEGNDYALARREVSTGDGYHDFKFDYGPDVTLEEDLMRRDFTINAIAYDEEEDEWIDPFEGIHDLRVEGVLRNIKGDTMIIDPLRTLRAARFLSEYPFLTDEVDYPAYPSIQALSAEKVWAETEKALMGIKPSNYFRFLLKHNMLHQWFPEIRNLVGKLQSFKWHMEGCSFEHTMMVLDSLARVENSLDMRFAALTHDLGKGTTPPDVLPSHSGHEFRGIALVESMANRLKIKKNMREAAKLTAEFHTHIHNFDKLKPKTKVKLYGRLKNNLGYYSDILGKVAFHDNEGKLPYTGIYTNHKLFIDTMFKIKTAEKIKVEPGQSINKIKHLKQQAMMIAAK